MLASEMWIYHSHLEYEHSYHQVSLENAQHCGVSLTEYMQNIEQLRAYDCHQNVTKPQATENHMKYTCDK